MFKITQSTSYTWPISVNLATDGGKFETQTFDGKFKRLGTERLEQIREAVKSDKDFAEQVLEGWDGVTDGDGQAVPFSHGALQQLLDIPGVATAVVVAFLDSLAGLKRKN